MTLEWKETEEGHEAICESGRYTIDRWGKWWRCRFWESIGFSRFHMARSFEEAKMECELRNNRNQ